MLRVRTDGQALDTRALRVLGDIRASSPAAAPTSATARTSNITGSASRTCPRSGGAWSPWGSRRPPPAATLLVASSAARWPASPPTRSSTQPRSFSRSSAASSGTPTWPISPQVQDRRHRPPEPRRRPRDQRHLPRRRRPSRLGPGVRPLGRRRSVHRATAGRADRCLRQRGRGSGGVAQRHQDLPRLRLSPPAQQGPSEVPPRRLGRRALPPGARGRIPRARPARRAGPEVPAVPGDHVGVHAQKDGRFYVGAAPTVGRVGGSTLAGLADLMDRVGAGRALHRLPEARHSRRAGRRRGRPRRRTAGSRPDRNPEPVPARDDGLHRHRVLQAGDRRHQGHRDRGHP